MRAAVVSDVFQLKDSCLDKQFPRHCCAGRVLQLPQRAECCPTGCLVVLLRPEKGDPGAIPFIFVGVALLLAGFRVSIGNALG